MLHRRTQSLILDPTDVAHLLKNHGIDITPEDDVTISLAHEGVEGRTELNLHDVCVVVSLVAEIGLKAIGQEPRFILPMANV